MYLDPATITDKLPSAYPQLYTSKYPGADAAALTTLWQNKVEAVIAHYSRYIDSSVGEQYPMAGTYKFPAWDASTPTPATISEICFYLAYSALVDYFTPVRKGSETEEERSYRDIAESLLKKIRSGEIVISLESSGSVGTVSKVSRTNVMTSEGFAEYNR